MLSSCTLKDPEPPDPKESFLKARSGVRIQHGMEGQAPGHDCATSALTAKAKFGVAETCERVLHWLWSALPMKDEANG